MPFAAGLQESLHSRGLEVPSEFIRGDSLESVLTRHLLAVEENFEGELVTSILLLSEDGTQLCHGAGPSLPQSYREAIDGAKIGPVAGSCGTAAFRGQPVYVHDIESDPLWAAYRQLALAHGLRSCWSTPIRSREGPVLGTFATYHRIPCSPTDGEIEAIAMITDLVANAIICARTVQDVEPFKEAPFHDPPELRPIGQNLSPAGAERLLRKLDKMETLAAELNRLAGGAESEEAAAALGSAAEECRRLIGLIRRQIEDLPTRRE